jgi:hypothetical protein
VLVNPTSSVPVLTGTRLLADGLGVLGATIEDPKTSGRVWQVTSLYAPVPGRARGGIRAKLVDNKGFTSFLNQRDLELGIGLARPGQWCQWLEDYYPGINDPEYFGPCLDAEDLTDDLLEREYYIRACMPSPLPSGLALERHLHLDHGQDVLERLTLLWDMDRETGAAPDCRLETVERRWARIEREKLCWQRLPP